MRGVFIMSGLDKVEIAVRIIKAVKGILEEYL